MIYGPYPGLRPFTEEQAGIFFGRSEQVAQLLDILSQSHFVAVVGVSGCGKSSLVRAGLIPALKAGFLADTGIEWRTATMYPGEHPMQNLAQALLQDSVFGQKTGSLSDYEALAFLLATLRRGRLGLLEARQEARFPEKTNLLLVVDQFEELFRQSVQYDVNEAIDFVALLLATAEKRSNIFVVITMRSDFLGDCPFFHGLPEAINASQFLTPRLTREQCQAAIEGPAVMFGSRVEPEVVTHLLNEMSTNPEQLPVLQHCLMRIWQHALERHGKTQEEVGTLYSGAPAQEIDLTWADYEAVGALQNAMSQHGEEALQELGNILGSEKAEQVTERFFRALVEVATHRSDMRRPPVSPAQIEKETALPQAQIRTLVEIFSSARFGFIQQYQSQDRRSQPKIGVTHESLIRLWERLNQWVNNEKDDSIKYLRLQQTAKFKQTRDVDWLSASELDTLWQWKETYPSNETWNAWAQRYGKAEDVELTLQFLNRRKQEEDEKRLAQERQRQAELRRVRRQRTLAVIGVIIALSLALWALWERSKAEIAQKAAQESQKKAELHSATFQDMVSTLFGFLSDSQQSQDFLAWIEKTATVTRLSTALHLMVDLSESMSADDKAYWHNALSSMSDEHKSQLLYLLGQEVLEKTKQQREAEQ